MPVGAAADSSFLDDLATKKLREKGESDHV